MCGNPNNSLDVLDGHVEDGHTWQSRPVRNPGCASIARLIDADISASIQDRNARIRGVIRVNREAVHRNVGQGAASGAINARQHRRGVQTDDLPDMRLRRGSAPRIVSERNVSCVLVCWIKNQTRDIEVRNHASSTKGIQDRQCVRAGGGEPERATVITNHSVVIVLRGNPNRAEGDSADLANGHICRSLCARSVQTVGAQIDRVRDSRPQRSWTIKIHRIRAVDAIRGSRSTATEKRPGTECAACETASITYLASRLVEIGVIHRSRSTLVYHRKAAVAVIRVKPSGSVREHLRSIILCATDADVRISGMHRDALKLGGSQG
jgi:hypothetical protein